MRLVILKYNAGNKRSVINAFERLGVNPTVSDDPIVLRAADAVVFPGVGEASSAMSHLRQRGLDSVIKDLEQPVLGICLGMQLLCTRSEENDTECIGVFETNVKAFPKGELKVPHTGWNTLISPESGLFKGVEDGSHVYFVHGYYVEASNDTTAFSEYGFPFSASLSIRNFHGVQFHPEKSGPVGEQILKNFLESI
jgi:glutamine amidotransferase